MKESQKLVKRRDKNVNLDDNKLQASAKSLKLVTKIDKLVIKDTN